MPTPPSTPTATLERLLALWRANKHPALAELIAAYARAHESRDAKQLRDKGKLDAKAWKAALADTPLLDLGALLSTLANQTAGVVAERITMLSTQPADPRIVDALHALIETLPWTSSGARKVWTRTTNTLAELGDPRTRAVVHAFDVDGIASYSESFGPWMAERLQKLALKLPEPAQLDDETEQLITQLRASLDKQRDSKSSSSLDTLQRRSLEQPDDLDARLVLADALLAAGDVRGEFIQVQIARESAPKDRKLAAREKLLLAEYRDRFLGVLAPIVRKGSLVFTRGFVSSCELSPQVHANVLASVLDDDLLLSIRSARGPLTFLLGPKLRNLREADLDDRSPSSLLPLLRCDHPLRLEALALPLPVGTNVALFDGCTCLPALRRLTLSGDAELLLRAIDSQLARRVSELNIERASYQRLPAMLVRALARNDGPGLVRCRYAMLGTHAWASVLELRRTEQGSLVGELLLTPPPPDWLGAFNQMHQAVRASLDAIQQLPVQTLDIRSSKPITNEYMRDTLHETATARVDRDRLVCRF